MSSMPPPPASAASSAGRAAAPARVRLGSDRGPAVNAGKATGALVCGIVGLFFCGVILGPVAIYLGMTAKREIQESGGRLKGSGMATAGIVLGIIALVTFVLSVILLVVV